MQTQIINAGVNLDQFYPTAILPPFFKILFLDVEGAGECILIVGNLKAEPCLVVKLRQIHLKS